MFYTRLQSFRPVSDKFTQVTPASLGEVSNTDFAADSCTAAHLEEFFNWERGTCPIWEGEPPRGKDVTTLVVECHYNPYGKGTYSYRFWREESVNN